MGTRAGAHVRCNEQGSFRGDKGIVCTLDVRTNVYVLYTRGGCCDLLWGVHRYTHIHISLDLGCVVCCSARDEARTHIHEDRFVLVEN